MNSGIHCVVSVIQKYIFDSYGTLYFGSDKLSMNVKRNMSTKFVSRDRSWP